jgi:hypothetical protein
MGYMGGPCLISETGVVKKNRIRYSGREILYPVLDRFFHAHPDNWPWDKPDSIILLYYQVSTPFRKSHERDGIGGRVEY